MSGVAADSYCHAAILEIPHKKPSPAGSAAGQHRPSPPLCGGDVAPRFQSVHQCCHHLHHMAQFGAEGFPKAYSQAADCNVFST